MVLGGALGPGFGACDAAPLCVAGVALGDIHLRFTWQAWHKLTSTVVLRGRRRTYGTGWRPWAGIWRLWRRATLRGRRGTTWHPPSFHVAGVAQTHIYRRFAWQAWHLWYWVAPLGRDLAPVTPRHFAWQAWHLATSTFVSRGRRGTNSHLPSFCVAGVALMVLGGALGPGFGACDAAPLCVAGVALGDIHLRFTWQAWHKLTSTVVLRGRRGTYGTGWRPWAGIWRLWRRATLRGRRGTWWHPPLFHVAGVAQTRIHRRFACTPLCHTPSLTHRHRPSFTHHLSHTDFVTRHLSHTTLSHTNFVTHHLSHTPTLSHTIFHTPLSSHCHTPSFTRNLSHTTLSHTIFDTPLCHTPLCHTPPFIHHLSHITLSHTIFHTPLCHIPSLTHRFFTHHFVTHHLSHTIFHTPLCHTPSFTTPSFTHHFVTHHLSPHHLSHTTLSHTIFHHTIFNTTLSHTIFRQTIFHTTLSHTIFPTQLCHTPSFTHNFRTHTHTHHLSHTTLSHTLSFLVTHQLSHTTLSHTTLFYFSILHHLLCLSFLPRPRYNIWCLLFKEVVLWGYPVL